MIRILIAASLLAATPTFARVEDAEHRADRLRTIELNSRAQAAVNRRDRSNADIRAANRKAQARYERERAEWRERVAACEDGDYSACRQ